MRSGTREISSLSPGAALLAAFPSVQDMFRTCNGRFLGRASIVRFMAQVWSSSQVADLDRSAAGEALWHHVS
jgi:hypothetical protein